MSGEEEAGDQHDEQQQEERDSRLQEEVLKIVLLVRIGHHCSTDSEDYLAD